MSVLVKDIKMPKRCLDCPMYDCYNYYCKLYSFGIPARYNGDGSIRPEWCELVELPEKHGRLIDADFEEQHYTSMTTNPTPDVTEKDKRNSLIIIEALQMAKTVIEAED